MTRTQKVAGAVVGVAALAGLIIGGVHLLTSTPQPPLKIRGGAMTLRYPAINNGNPWFSYPAPPGAPAAYCTPLDASSGKLKIFQHPDPDPDDQSPAPQKFSLTGNWVVDLYGRNSDFTTEPHSGLELKPVSNCNGNNNGIEVYPLPGSTNVDFYPADLPPGTGNTYGKRYRKSGCSDEDACEHLSTIYVSVPSGQPQSVDCQNGDCLVKITPR